MTRATDGDVVTALARLDRRGFLRLVGAAAATGFGPTGCAGLPPALAPPPGASLAVLTPRQYAVFTAAAARLVGPAGAPLIAERTVDVGLLADGWLAGMPGLAAPLGAGLLVLELGVFPLVRKVRPFTGLDGVAQDAVLADLMTSRLELKRTLFAGVRSLAMATFYGAPETRALTGYPGPFGDARVTVGDAMTAPDAWT